MFRFHASVAQVGLPPLIDYMCVVKGGQRPSPDYVLFMVATSIQTSTSPQSAMIRIRMVPRQFQGLNLPLYNLPTIPMDFATRCYLLINGQATPWDAMVYLLEGSVGHIRCATIAQKRLPTSSSFLISQSDSSESSATKRPRTSSALDSAQNSSSSSSTSTPGPPGLDLSLSWCLYLVWLLAGKLRRMTRSFTGASSPFRVDDRPDPLPQRMDVSSTSLFLSFDLAQNWSGWEHHADLHVSHSTSTTRIKQGRFISACKPPVLFGILCACWVTLASSLQLSRIGEAKNPGPSFWLGATNPSGLSNKEVFYTHLPRGAWGVSESQLTRYGQRQTRQRLQRLSSAKALTSTVCLERRWNHGHDPLQPERGQV